VVNIRRKFAWNAILFVSFGLCCSQRNCPSLEVLKARLDGALSNLVQWKVSLAMTEGLELDDL